MTAAPLKVLVIDDEPPIRKLLRMGLTAQGYQILEAPNGKAALELLSQEPDLVILDLGLPDIQGHELLRMIRARNDSVPIVVLSSRGDEAGKVQALDFGADDYVTKPFGMDELLARMRAALRHQLQVHGERPVFHVGDLSVDLVRRIVRVGERDVKLSPKEYELLRVLVQHAGKVLTHKFLLGELWDELTDAQYLRVYVRQLRQKIEADHERPQYLLTETGIGYRLRAPTEKQRLPLPSLAKGACFKTRFPDGASMDIKEFLSPVDALVDVTAPDKARLLQELARRAAATLNLAAEPISNALLEREKLGSTGTGGGIAIPHARIPGLNKPFGILVRLKQPIDFDAIDGQPVDLLFLLLLPVAPNKQQLNVLASVARTLRDAKSVRDLRCARDNVGLFEAMVVDSGNSRE